MKKFLNLTALLTMFAALSFGIMSCDDGDFTSFIGGKESKGGGGDVASIWTVTFNNNGGSGEMDPQKFTEGVAQKLTANKFTPPSADKVFSGWLVNSPDATVGYSDEESIRLKSNITLYARWLDKGTATYYVKHFKQKEWLSTEYEEVTDTPPDSLTGNVGELTKAKARSYVNYKELTIEQKPISDKTATIVNVYYDLLSETVVNGNDPYITVGSATDVKLTLNTTENTSKYTATLSGDAVTGNTKYHWYLNGIFVGSIDASSTSEVDAPSADDTVPGVIKKTVVINKLNVNNTTDKILKAPVTVDIDTTNWETGTYELFVVVDNTDNNNGVRDQIKHSAQVYITVSAK